MFFPAGEELKNSPYSLAKVLTNLLFGTKEEVRLYRAGSLSATHFF